MKNDQELNGLCEKKENSNERSRFETQEVAFPREYAEGNKGDLEIGDLRWMRGMRVAACAVTRLPMLRPAFFEH